MIIKLAGLFFSLLLLSVSVSAQRDPSPEEETFFTNAMAKINTKHVRWIKATASEMNAKSLTTDDVMSKTKSYAVLGNLNGADIEALAFLVLMQAAKSAQEDLKAIMAQVKSINEEKNKVRDALTSLGDNRRTFTRAQLDSFKLLAKPATAIQKTKTGPSSREVTQSEINETTVRLKEKRDSLSELGEEQQLRLQLIMDRRSKMMSTLSNLMKKISQTQDSIIANLK